NCPRGTSSVTCDSAAKPPGNSFVTSVNRSMRARSRAEGGAGVPSPRLAVLSLARFLEDLVADGVDPLQLLCGLHEIPLPVTGVVSIDLLAAVSADHVGRDAGRLVDV